MKKNKQILTADQQAVLRMMAEETDLANEYVLSGGTALAAFHLHHRRSDDLDFFTLQSVDSLHVHGFAEKARKKLGMDRIEPSRLYDRHLFLLTSADGRELKLEFTQYPYAALTPSMSIDGVQVESLRDIAADKLAALLDRFEPKDYYDIYAILEQKKTALPTMRTDAEKKFHLRIDPVQLGAAFARSTRLPILPHLLKPIAQKEIEKFFLDLARSLRGEVVDGK